MLFNEFMLRASSRTYEICIEDIDQELLGAFYLDNSNGIPRWLRDRRYDAKMALVYAEAEVYLFSTDDQEPGLLHVYVTVDREEFHKELSLWGVPEDWVRWEDRIDEKVFSVQDNA